MIRCDNAAIISILLPIFKQMTFKARSHRINEYMIRLMTKPTKWPVRPAKTQISLGNHPVLSKSSLCAQWVAKDQSFFMRTVKTLIGLGAYMPRLIWVFAGRTCHFVGFVMRRLNYLFAVVMIIHKRLKETKLIWREEGSTVIYSRELTHGTEETQTKICMYTHLPFPKLHKSHCQT